ncbi:hypothetical protein BDY21DRAFT_357742 [Lineolata rhizophorae]|uniref:Uncharacterized protein n=1 Tax=Lineolata rhizophorae TaxID=578093 RepID=A0A6A6NM94_9PEZI|nr:hypothetical protein BDY21DRAFT_357742 [Lineolata rhizophorae]
MEGERRPPSAPPACLFDRATSPAAPRYCARLPLLLPAAPSPPRQVQSAPACLGSPAQRPTKPPSPPLLQPRSPHYLTCPLPKPSPTPSIHRPRHHAAVDPPASSPLFFLPSSLSCFLFLPLSAAPPTRTPPAAASLPFLPGSLSRRRSCLPG